MLPAATWSLHRLPRGPNAVADIAHQPAPQELLAHALASVANAIFLTDSTGAIVWVNDAFVRLSGFSLEDVIRRTPTVLRSGKQSADFYTQLWQTIQSGQVWQGDVVDRRKDGSLYTVDEIITPLFDEQGIITHFIAIQHDITGRNKEGDRARHLAYHDSLTDLPNRACFFGLLETALLNARRNKHMFATLFVDLDHFKPVNDTLGHHIGDQLLVAVAERIRVALRHADTVARIGGDEFVILINDLEDAHIATKLAQKLVETLAHPFVLSGQAIHISASIGVSIYPMDGVDPQDLLMHADQAMYHAKYCGGNQFQLYLATPAEKP